MSRPSRKRRPATPDVLQPGSLKERQLRERVQLLEWQEAGLLYSLDKQNREFVKRLIQTLSTLELCADPLRSSPLEAQMRYRQPDSSVDEGSSTRWARSLAYRIRTEGDRLIHETEQRIAGTWEPNPKSEKVRCVNKSCDRYGKRIPRYVGPSSEIELVYCDGLVNGFRCGGKLGKA